MMTLTPRLLLLAPLTLFAAPLIWAGGDAHAEWNRRAAALVDEERFLEAEATLRGLVRRMTAQHGPNSVKLAQPLNNLAVAYRRLRRLRNAENTYERSLEIRSTHFGDRHPATVLVRVNLGRLYQQMGQLQAAEMLLMRAVSDAEASGDIGVRAAAHHNLAALLLRQGRYPGALAQLEEAVPLWRQAGSPADEAKALGMRAEALRRAGHHREATAAFAGALARAREALGPAHPETARIQEAYARTLRKTGHKREARRLLSEAKAMLQAARERGARSHIVDASALRR